MIKKRLNGMWHLVFEENEIEGDRSLRSHQTVCNQLIEAPRVAGVDASIETYPNCPDCLSADTSDR